MALPEGWRGSRLDHEAQILKGSASGTGGSWLRVFKTRHVYDGFVKLDQPVFANDARAEKINPQTLLKDGDTLTPNMAHGTIGRVAFVRYAESDWTVDGQIFILRPKDASALDERFLFDWVSSPWVKKQLVNREKGGAFGSKRGQTHLYKSDVASIEIWLPPLGEQRKIAAILSSVDEAIEKTQAVIEQVQVVKRGLMQELLTKGLPGRHKRFKQTEIGEIPADWEVVPFGTALIDGPTNGLYKPRSLYGSGTPIVRIDSYQNGTRVDLAKLLRVDIEPHEISRYSLAAGDILINRVNSVSHLGKSGIVPSMGEATVFESNMMKVTLDSLKCLPDFGFLYLSSEPTRRHWQLRAKQAVAQASINQTDVKTLPLPIPPLEEQAEITHTAMLIEQRLTKERLSAITLKGLKKALMSVLLTGELRVTPDPG